MHSLRSKVIALAACVIGTVSTGFALPAGWKQIDIGEVGSAGTTTEAGGTWTITGGGENIWGGTQEFSYTYIHAQGDCSITTRVTNVTGTSWSTNGGLMIREKVASGVKYARLGLTRNSGSVFHTDDLAGGTWTSGVPPYWLRLARVGNAITASISPDGTAWTTVGTRTVTMGADVTMGLTVCRGNNNDAELASATFTNVSTTNAVHGNWESTNVGPVGTPGSYTTANGVFNLTGSGYRIWGNDQQFLYVHQPMAGNGTGNGSIAARITSQTVAHYYGISGVMIRDSLAPEAACVFLAREAGGALKWHWHGYNQGWGNNTTVSPGPAAPVWLKVTRVGNVFTGHYSTNGSTWTQVGLPYTVSMSTDANAGMFLVSGTNAGLGTTVFDNVATEGTDPLSTGWTSNDLGTPGIAGYGEDKSGVFNIEGSGTGFYGNADSGHFVHKGMWGDKQIVASVVTQSASDNTAPAGLMMRDSLAAASRNVALTVSANGTLKWQYHTNAGDLASTVVNLTGVSTPYWLKIARVGNVFTGYYSPDGWNWLTAGSATIAMTNTYAAGLAVSSKSNAAIAAAAFDNVSAGAVADIPPATTPVMTDITSGLTLIDTIDTGTTAPSYVSAAGVDTVVTIAGKQARTLPVTGTLGNTAATMAYVVGAGKGLVAGRAYVLTVEYPEDVSRSMFVVNRGADYYRGVSTGTTIGDAREQFVEPSAESLNYPLSGGWTVFKQYFHLMERFQGVAAVRNPAVGWRPYGPADGFHVVINRTRKTNDVRNEGAAVGIIRLYEVTDPKALYAPIHYPPPNLPWRSTFWREEMADNAVQWASNPPNAADTAFSDPLDWHTHKMKMAKVLGINTYTKDCLEFGYNQGWPTGDVAWTMDAQAPLTNIWPRIVKRAAEEGLKVMPYLEYKTGVGVHGQGLALQRRAQKLYHGIKTVCGSTSYYQCIYWTENANGDLTDPDTLVDAKRMLDRVVGDNKYANKFQGVWFRLRGNHLPMSFAATTIARYKAAYPSDATAQTAAQATLITSYEGDKVLYNHYVNWWLNQRKVFLTTLRDYIRNDIGIAGAEVLFTPWTGEPVMVLHSPGNYYQHAGIVTDDVAWWTPYFNSLPVSSLKYKWGPTSWTTVTANNWYRGVLEERPPIIHNLNPSGTEPWHSAPHADPLNYTSTDGVSMTFPMGRLFTVASDSLLNDYRSGSGLTVVRHYPLNEDMITTEPSPFNGQLGYLSVDSDRGSHHLMLVQARAVANGDPRNIGYLAGSSFSTGFPEIMRRFNQAFLAVPAVPSTKLTGASTDAEVVVRQYTTSGQGTYYYVVNTSMSAKTVTVTLPGSGTVKNLVTWANESGTTLNLTLDSAELRAYRVGP